MGAITGILLALSLGGSMSDGQVVAQKTVRCEKKRVDACGCHHVYGLRHCHPTRKTDHCEAPVKFKLDDPPMSKQEEPKPYSF